MTSYLYRLMTIFTFVTLFQANADELDRHLQSAYAQGDTLVIANSKAWKPFSYIDNLGHPQGLLIDIWKEYAKVNNIKVKFVLTDWKDSIELVRTGKADVHAGLLWSEERSTYLDFLDGVVGIETQLFISATYLGSDIDHFLRTEKVGVVAGGYEEHYLKENFSFVEMVSYKNNELMLMSAFDGNINAFVADFQVANFYLYTSYNPASFSPVKHLYSAQIKPAVIEGNHKLRVSLETGMKNISDVDLQRIRRKWVHVETVYPKYLFQFVFFLLLALALLYILQLRKTVSSRTAQLRKLNLELLYQASTDSLTGIYNRRYFIKSLEEACLSMNNEVSLTLLLFDIDKFKSINDNFGHMAGDYIIKEMAKVVTDVIPTEAIFARVGGEEFCLFIHNLTVQEAKALSHKVQACISVNPFEWENTSHQVSVSLGAVYRTSGAYDHQYLINQADHLMYIAKSLGRDGYQFKTL